MFSYSRPCSPGRGRRWSGSRRQSTPIGTWLAGALPDSALRSLLVDGVIAGAGAVLVFLPQVLILFFFILLLEDSGYLPRAAFLLDRLMGSVGLSGRSFIPLLSSFACAVPGIMATRTIPNPRDRWITIMIAPLMTCSARLPVYAMLIGAFIPARLVGPGIQLQGLVLFALYVAGIVSAFAVAFVLTRHHARTGRTAADGAAARITGRARATSRLGLLERARVFMRRVGTTILALMVVLWALSSFPAPPGRCDRTGDPVQPCRPARRAAGARARASRLQLADLDRASVRPGRARGRRRCARHGVLDVSRRRGRSAKHWCR